MSKRTLVTAALPYANGPLHLGHLAGAYLPADFFVRFQRLKGHDIVFICGSDEHGVPITLAAEKEGVQPQDIVDRYHSINKKAFEEFGISFDYFGRTSSETHKKTSQDFFTTLLEKNVFRKKAEQQLFDQEAGMFLPDRYVKGTCPVCGFEEAYGDQCEKCGTSLSPSELKNPKSVLTGGIPELRETEHWFLPLGDFQPWLEEWIGSKTDWKSNVLGQCRSWLQSGLSDRAVTRDLRWGVPVPVEGSEGKVLYVWFDAPIGYISATKEWAEQKGDPEKWKSYWQNEDSRLIHFIGKDNIVFHCIMFPAMLKAHGAFVVPENVPANEFLNLESRKLSTSRGWAVWLHEYLETFEPDYLRYVLGSTFPETKDSDFSWKDFQTRSNSELADILGNFLFRTLSFTARYFDGKVPPLTENDARAQEVLHAIASTKELVSKAYESYQFREAVAQTMNLARLGNKYFTEMEPWHLRKTDMEACGNVLHVCLQLAAALSVMFDPVTPTSMKKLREYLGLSDTLGWDDVSDSMLQAHQEVQQGEILFKKIEDDQVAQQKEKLLEKSQVTSPSDKATEQQWAPLKSETDYNTFIQTDLRTGVIREAQAVPKSKKLLKLRVDLGFETRTIVSGIAEYFTPEETINQKVVVVANLAPRKIMNIESQGMILMAQNEDGSLHFVSSDGSAGSTIS